MRAARASLTRSSFLVVALAAAAAWPARAEGFDRVAVIEPNVAFWRKVYAVWGINDIAFHDREDMSIIYRVVRVPGHGKKENGVNRAQAIEKARKETIEALKALAKKKPKSAEGLGPVEKEVFENLKDVTRADKYTRPVDLVRAQNGLKERARQGWIDLGKYEKGVRAEIQKSGMPQEILALAFVESLFNVRAVSHAGAAGMWQFMPATGREYMYVNDVVDERIDPILATEAAMKYLHSAKKMLGAWPLAITSYNYGRAGMKRASDAMGTRDFGVLYQKYNGSKNFGFAAKNYYASFLALLDVIKAPEKYFKDVERKAGWRFDVVRLPFPVLAPQLEKAGAIASVDELWAYNPALTKKARAGDAALPRGLPLRVPYGQGTSFLEKLGAMTFAERKRALHHVSKWHTANGRQSLASIAKRYSADVAEVAAFSGLAIDSVPANGSKVAIPSSPAKYSLFPEARGLGIPDAPAIPEAVLASITPQAPPVEKPVAKPETFVKRVDGRAQVRLVWLKSAPVEKPLPGVDLIVGGNPEPLGEVDVIAGDPGADAPWPLFSGEDAASARGDEGGLAHPETS